MFSLTKLLPASPAILSARIRSAGWPAPHVSSKPPREYSPEGTAILFVFSDRTPGISDRIGVHACSLDLQQRIKLLCVSRSLDRGLRSVHMYDQWHDNQHPDSRQFQCCRSSPPGSWTSQGLDGTGLDEIMRGQHLLLDRFRQRARICEISRSCFLPLHKDLLENSLKRIYAALEIHDIHWNSLNEWKSL